MSDRPVSNILVAIESTIGYKPTRNGRGWQSRCPAHDDKLPSLSVAEGDDGRALVMCHAGCSAEAIVKSVGLTLRDLMSVDALTVDNTPQHGPRRRVLSTSTPAMPPTTYMTANAAVTELERRQGPRSAIWTYHDGTGEPIGLIVRWDRTGGSKDVRPVARNGAGWIIGGMPVPRPLYCLPELADATCIFIAEGEKAVDALRALKLVSTTSPHGSKGAAAADRSPLAGKTCMIVPDNDVPGKKYARDVEGLLARLSATPTVKRIELPDLPAGGDEVEYIAARRAAGLDDDAIRTELERLVDTAEPIELKRSGPVIERNQSFPVQVLLEPVRSFIAKGATAIGCDASYVALPMLSALASAIRNTRRIQLKRGWAEPAIIWTAIMGESGTLKTPAFKLVMQPIRDRQGEALKRYAEEQAEHEIEVQRYEKALSAWKRDKTDYDPPDKPQPPQAVRYIVSDTTVEAIAPILLDNPGGLLMARDELAGWIGSFDRYAAEALDRGGNLGDGDPRARTISLPPERKRAWITFYNEHAHEHADLTGDLSAAWSRLEGYAARLALIVHLTRWAADDPALADADRVDETSSLAGVALSRWFGHEARHLYDVLAEPDDERERRRLVELIQRKGGSATARGLMRSSRKFKTAADAEAALEELVKMAWAHGARPRPARKAASRARSSSSRVRIDSTIRCRRTLLAVPTLTIPRLATPKTRVLSTSTVSTLLTTHRIRANPTRPRPRPTMMSTMTSGGKSDAGDNRQR